MQFWLEPFTTDEEASPGVDSSPAEAASIPNATQAVGSQSASACIQVHPAEAELLRALDRAESTPGWNFVSLKKFRDEILP
ncbi:MAG: hypothetical protein WBY61_22080, partial [Terriglobales bacterium]